MKIRIMSAMVPVMVYAAGMLSGCNSIHNPAQLMEGVPDDAVVVKVVDLGLVLKEAGGGVTGADRRLTSRGEQIVDLVVEPDFRNILGRVVVEGDGTVDMSEVVVFTTGAGRDIITFRLNDAEGFCRAMGCVPEKSDIISGPSDRGFMRADVDSMAVVFDDTRCWISIDYDDIRGALAGAHEEHFGTLIGVSEFLTSPGAAKLAVNCGRSSLSFLGNDNRWLCVGFDLTETSVSAEGVVMDRDGALDSIGRNFQEINTDFLRYTPENAAVVLAFGRFEGNVRGLEMILGRFAPVYLSQADGTTSLYAVPGGSVAAVAEAEPGSWNVETMVHVPQEMIREGLRQYKERAGNRLFDLGNQWSYRDGDGTYYFGVFDGCLVFSTNREISSEYNNSFADDFLGRRAAMAVNVPFGSVLARAWRLPFGLSFRLSVDAMRVKGRISFNGSDQNALCSLLQLPQLPDFKERFQAYTAR